MTPLPWRRGKTSVRSLYGARTDRDLIATFYNEADAITALRAVSSHDALVKALQNLHREANLAAGRQLVPFLKAAREALEIAQGTLGAAPAQAATDEAAL